ncbi:MAG TPA: flagellar biosynthetic protein FliO [Bryobacteraceae bacterium]|nr:flagellar biosynthetic protein FliO [Bryobacteraceae bacterium]
MVQQIIAILLVFGLLAGTLTLLRKKGLAHFSGGLPRIKSQPKQMRVIERIALSPHHALHLVHVESSTFLIGVSPSGCSRIATLSGSAGTEE